jgi:hypothetical protein
MHTQTSMPWARFEPMTTVFEWVKTSSCLRLRGHCNRLPIMWWNKKYYCIIIYQWKCDCVLHSWSVVWQPHICVGKYSNFKLWECIILWPNRINLQMLNNFLVTRSLTLRFQYLVSCYRTGSHHHELSLQPESEFWVLQINSSMRDGCMCWVGDDWLTICRTDSLLYHSVLLTEPTAYGKCKVPFSQYNPVSSRSVGTFLSVKLFFWF